MDFKQSTQSCTRVAACGRDSDRIRARQAQPAAERAARVRREEEAHALLPFVRPAVGPPPRRSPRAAAAGGRVDHGVREDEAVVGIPHTLARGYR